MNKEHEPGEHNISWNAQDYLGNFLGSGIYIYKLEAGSSDGNKKYTKVNKLIYLK